MLLTFTAFLLGQLGRISFGDGAVNIYLYEILIYVTITFLLFKHKFYPLISIVKKAPFLLAFLVYMIITFLFRVSEFSLQENTVAFLYLVRLGLYFLYFSFLTYEERSTLPKSYHSITQFSFISLVLLSMVQYFLYPDLRNLYYQGWDPHLYRAFGTFLEPVILGTVTVLYVLYFFFHHMKKSFRTILLVAGVLIGLLSFARSVYLGLVMTILLYFSTKKKTVLIGFLILFVIGILLLPKSSGEGLNLLRTSTIISRAESYQQGLALWNKNPLFGTGYNRIAYEKNREGMIEKAETRNHAEASLHSSFLIILVTGGAIGLFLFGASLYHLAKFSVFSYYAVVFLSVVSLFDNVLLHPFVLFTFFTFTAFSTRSSPESR